MNRQQRRKAGKQKTLLISPDPEKTVKGNYFAELVELQRKAGPGVFQVEVFHDDWCALLVLGLACDCSPGIRLTRKPGGTNGP